MARIARTLKEWAAYADQLEAKLGVNHPTVLRLRAQIIAEKLKRSERRYAESKPIVPSNPRTSPVKAHIINRLKRMTGPKIR
jgi:hypothetical protein